MMQPLTHVENVGFKPTAPTPKNKHWQAIPVPFDPIPPKSTLPHNRFQRKYRLREDRHRSGLGGRCAEEDSTKPKQERGSLLPRRASGQAPAE